MKKYLFIFSFVACIACSHAQQSPPLAGCPSGPLAYPCDTNGNYTYGNFDILNVEVAQDTINAILRRVLKLPALVQNVCPTGPLQYPCDSLGNSTYGNFDILNVWVQQDTTISLLKKLVAASTIIVSDSAWSLKGNSGITAGKFLGTTDGNALEFKVNGNKSGWIDYTTPNNTYFGYEAGLNNASGNDNVGIGYFSLKSTTGGYQNTALGFNTLTNNLGGYWNTATGFDAVESNTTGFQNTGVGVSALFSNTTGSSNTSIGYQSLGVSTTASTNTAIGAWAGYNNTTGENNVYLGDSAGFENTSLSNQVYIGDSTHSYNIKFDGALMPYYSSNYQAGTSGQVLTSQGPGVSPQWAAGGGLPYTEWDAHISQVGTNNPTIDSVTYNSAGLTITTGRSGTGLYSLTLTAGTLHSINRCLLFLQLTGYSGGFSSSYYGAAGIAYASPTSIAISTVSINDISILGATYSDGVMAHASIKIIIF